MGLCCWKQWVNEEEGAARMGNSISIFLPLGVEMDWKILWRIQVWSSSSWTSCLQSGAANTRRHVRSSCSCLTSRLSPFRSCCRVPAQAQWILPCRRVSGQWTGPVGRDVGILSLIATSVLPFPQKHSSVISFLCTCKGVFVKCYRGLGKSN